MSQTTQKTTQKQSTPNLETAMKSFLTMVAIVMATLTLTAPLNAWAKPTPQCLKMGNKLLETQCKDESILKAARAKCPEVAQAECPLAPAPEASAKVAPAPIEDLAPKPESKIEVGKSVATNTWSFGSCYLEAPRYITGAFPVDGQIGDFTNNAPARIEDKEGGAWKKAGINDKSRKLIIDNHLASLAKGFNAATNNARAHLPLETLDKGMNEAMNRFCKQSPDGKSLDCGGTPDEMAAKALDIYKGLPENQREKDTQTFCSRLEKLDSLTKAAKKYNISVEKAKIGQSCACILLMPAPIRDFNLAGDTWHDRKVVKDPTTLVKGQRVYVLTPAGEVKGELAEAVTDGTAKINTGSENPTPVAIKDIQDGKAKFYADPPGGPSDPNAVNPIGKTIIVSDGKGHSVTGVGTKYENNTIEATGFIESLTGERFRLGLGYDATYGGYNGDKSVAGNALNAFVVTTGWELKLSEKWSVMPLVKGGFGYVTGESSARRFNTPDNERVVPVLAGGLRGSFYLIPKVALYLEGEGYGFPGPGVSGGIGALWHFSDKVALDVSAHWLFMPDTGVASGILNLSEMKNVRVNGGGLSVMLRL